MYEACQDKQQHAKLCMYFWQAHHRRDPKARTIDGLLDETEKALQHKADIDNPIAGLEYNKARKVLDTAKRQHRMATTKLEKCHLATEQAKAMLTQATAAEEEAAASKQNTKEDVEHAVAAMRLALEANAGRGGEGNRRKEQPHRSGHTRVPGGLF